MTGRGQTAVPPRRTPKKNPTKAYRKVCAYHGCTRGEAGAAAEFVSQQPTARFCGDGCRRASDREQRRAGKVSNLSRHDAERVDRALALLDRVEALCERHPSLRNIYRRWLVDAK